MTNGFQSINLDGELWLGGTGALTKTPPPTAPVGRVGGRWWGFESSSRARERRPAGFPASHFVAMEKALDGEAQLCRCLPQTLHDKLDWKWQMSCYDLQTV